jgi:tRNA threonylcarbamoyladenosine biosynthesis protein TsaE
MNVKTQYRCKTLQNLPDAARALLSTWPDARIFAFYGHMGAGKTTFIQAICAELEVIDTVNSPTFAIVNEYMTRQREKVYHFDFYRINSIMEVMDIGYEIYFYGGDICLIEWPEKITELLPENCVYVHIDVEEESGDRIISF